MASRMHTIIDSRFWLLVFCVAVVGIYSSKYIDQSLSLMLVVSLARLFIALLAGAILVSVFAMVTLVLSARLRSLRHHTLLALRVALVILALMAAGSIGTTIPEWLVATF